MHRHGPLRPPCLVFIPHPSLCNIMSVLPPTSTWDTIQNVFYRKEEVYQMSWNVPDLSDYLVAAAKNGGPIGESTSTSIIKIYS